VLNRGSCLAFSGASYARCNWYKRSPVALTSYTDAAGAVLRFAPGPTWVVLAPSGAQVTAT